MKIPELAMQVKIKVELLEEAEQTGVEANVITELVELRELLNDQPELEAGGACESSESS